MSSESPCSIATGYGSSQSQYPNQCLEPVLGHLKLGVSDNTVRVGQVGPAAVVEVVDLVDDADVIEIFDVSVSLVEAVVFIVDVELPFIDVKLSFLKSGFRLLKLNLGSPRQGFRE